MLLAIITLCLIAGTSLLIRRSKIKISRPNYLFVLIAGLMTLLFEPFMIVLFTDGSADGGAIQIVSTLVGIYAIIWSIIRLIKYNKDNNKK